MKHSQNERGAQTDNGLKTPTQVDSKNKTVVQDFNLELKETEQMILAKQCWLQI